MYMGIDLGTTNTVVSRSFVDADGRLITEVIQLGQMYQDNWEKFFTLPSMIYFDGDQYYVGREAKRQREWDREHVITNSKRFMGTSHTWNIDGQTLEAKDVAAMVLQHCKKTVEREGNMNYETVVITVPASFNPEQIEDTMKAAKQAGFQDDQIKIRHEPTAALLSFIDGEVKKSKQDRYLDLSKKKRIMVFDLGGGTCDISIIDVQVGDREMCFQEVAIGRYQELGGIDFDNRLALGLLNRYFKENQILEGTVSDREKNDMYVKLLLAAETIKEKLTSVINAKLSMADGVQIDKDSIGVKHNIPQFYNGRPFRIQITKAEYDEYTKELYIDTDVHYKKFEDMEKHKNIITIIRKTLEDYGISKDSIDYVFMTGGMSQFPTVQEKISQYVGRPVIVPENPMDAVARGASIYQYYKIREESLADGQGQAVSETFVDNMMLAEAVMLDMKEGLPRVIIPKKTVVPYSGEIRGEFTISSPSGIKLDIYIGENEWDSSMRIQKSLEKPFNFPVQTGTPFDIEYTINENKAIEMKIIVQGARREEVEVSIRSDIRIKEQDYNIVIDE